MIMKLKIAQGPQATVEHVALWDALQLNLHAPPVSWTYLWTFSSRKSASLLRVPEDAISYW
jgi:hypothetical protein